MNNWNPWEDRWRTWTPRRPSAKLKVRLFSRAQTWPSPLLNWLRPARLAAATGFCFLTLILLSPNQLNAPRSGHARNYLWASARSSTGLAAMLASSQLNSERNEVPLSFEWTNIRSSSSSVGSFLLLDTNSLRQ